MLWRSLGDGLADALPALRAALSGFRAACAWTARSQGAARLAGPPEALAVHLRFVPPDRRRRDLDNCIAAMKSGLDGLADVLGVDDNRWTLSAELLVGQVGGMVKVEVVA